MNNWLIRSAKQNWNFPLEKKERIELKGHQIKKFSATNSDRRVQCSKTKQESSVVLNPHRRVWGFKSRVETCRVSIHRIDTTLQVQYSTAWLWNPGQTSPEIQNRDISGPTKRTYVLQFFLKMYSTANRGFRILWMKTWTGDQCSVSR